MERLIRDAISKELNAKQPGFMEIKFCQTILIPLFDEITGLVDKGHCVDRHPPPAVRHLA